MQQKAMKGTGEEAPWGPAQITSEAQVKTGAAFLEGFLFLSAHPNLNFSHRLYAVTPAKVNTARRL